MVKMEIEYFRKVAWRTLKWKQMFSLWYQSYSPLHEDTQDLHCYFSKEHSEAPQVLLLVHSSSEKTQEKCPFLSAEHTLGK